MTTILDYIHLMRLNRPVGILLLLWPALWSLWFAAEGVPNLKILSIFIAGTMLMRSAGCVINDCADRNFDKYVERTKDRPITSGKISLRNAIILFATLSSIAFILVLMTNQLTIFLACIGMAILFIYPFMKRITDFPQLILGLAFAMAVPMSFAAQINLLPFYAWLIFLAVVMWTIAYDTEYAMVDREDDLLIGVRSTAIRFGHWDRWIIAILQLGVLLILGWIGCYLALSIWYFAGLTAAGCSFIYQQWLIRDRDIAKSFQAFLNNQWSGAMIFLGILLHYYFY